MITKAERTGRSTTGLADDEFYYSVRISGIYRRSTASAQSDQRKDVCFSVYHVRDGQVAEELGPEQALAALVQLGLVVAP